MLEQRGRNDVDMKKEYVFAAYTIFCWGTLPVVTKLTLTSISNMQVLFISSLIASVCLWLYLFLCGKWQMVRLLKYSDLWQLTALGLLGNFLYSAFYYASLRTLPSADACIINYLWPIIATICAAVVLHEKICNFEWLAILFSFAGVIIISVKDNKMGIANLQGVLLCVAGAFCYGIFNVLNKKKGLDQLFCTAIYFAVTTVCSGMALLVTKDISPMSGRTWGGILWLGVVIDALAIVTWGMALQGTDVGFLSNFAYLTPVVAAILSFFILHEQIGVYVILGMAFILGGCFLQIYNRKRLMDQKIDS